MIRRPLLAAAALCATLTLTACNGSPEAGRPNTTPPPTASPTTTPTPSPSTPTWTEEEQAAITSAKARYLAARAAVDKAFAEPAKLDRNALQKSGNGGEWIIAVIGDAMNLERYGWYRSGTVKVSSTQVTSVKLGIEQPEVRLTNCIDTSGVVSRFQKDHQPVPMGPGNGKRHKFSSQLVFAPPAEGGAKMWFLVADKAAGTC
ncbi:hypothetical protein GCM10009744_64340 [Kribbella alba]|uniref:Lipoprotein n=1 Tax=Kribbella alba TaxID=190197 RepID=A0ABP4RWH1_9ACTN